MQGNFNIIIEWEAVAFTANGEMETEPLNPFIGSRFDAQSKANELADECGHPWRVRLTNTEDPHDFYDSDYLDFDEIERYIRNAKVV